MKPTARCLDPEEKYPIGVTFDSPFEEGRIITFKISLKEAKRLRKKLKKSIMEVLVIKIKKAMDESPAIPIISVETIPEERWLPTAVYLSGAMITYTGTEENTRLLMKYDLYTCVQAESEDHLLQEALSTEACNCIGPIRIGDIIVVDRVGDTHIFKPGAIE